MTVFLIVLGTIFIAEMGDKTQLLLVAMAGKYKIFHILAGTWLATLLLNGLAVFVGAALSQYLDMRIVKLAAGAAFFWFAYSALKGGGDEENEKLPQGRLGPVPAIFGTFFLGELGDKTQLSAITLAASYTQHDLSNTVAVFAGCTAGLIAGLFLRSKMPTGLLNKISFLIFAAFGAASIREAAGLIFDSGRFEYAFVCLACLSFVTVCVLTVRRTKRI